MDIPCRVRLTEAVGKHPAGLTGTLVDVGDDHVFIRLDGGRLLKVPCPYFPELPYEPVSVLLVTHKRRAGNRQGRPCRAGAAA